MSYTSHHKTAENILFAASEVTPFSNSGGLSMVTGALPIEFANEGKNVTVVSPYYQGMDKEFAIEWLPHPIHVPFQQTRMEAEVGKIEQDNVTYLFVRHPLLERPKGKYYGQENDSEAFAFFCRAVPEAAHAINFKPDVLHAHDWQTGYLPVILEHSDASLLPKAFRNLPTIFTIHRGEFFGDGCVDPHTMASWLRLPHDIQQRADFEYNGIANPVWSAVGNATKTTTVSPTYAEELIDPNGYMGMNYHEFSDKMSGVINGIRQERFNPEEPLFFNHAFSHDDLSGKELNKEELSELYGIEPSDRPIIGIVTRISEEKGVQLIADSIDELVEQGWDVIIAGQGNPHLEQQFHEKSAQHKGHVTFANAWMNEKGKHEMFGGCDATLIPSKSEPCGLTQMEAQAYGTLPIARKVGGLADTIDDGVTGFLFEEYSKEALLEATGRAMDAYRDREQWQGMMNDAMSLDHSWKQSATTYLELYDDVVQQKAQSRGFASRAA
ncbi:MAG: glycogen synthase [Alphaproteobacteria bacterium]|nr:MAG: glycogen synthase [Alphaproteobacteria bacterium]